MTPNSEETYSGYTRGELCAFASSLCAQIQAEAGEAGYRGGIFAGNVTAEEDGSVTIGSPAEGEMEGTELLYSAPELYWDGKKTPACDVYSVGLLLYNMSEGHLPFESEDCSDRKAQQLRLQGKPFNPPANAGRRLGDIIVKALSFDTASRYRNVGEMKIMLDNCLKNLFLKEDACAEAVFKKNDDDLSDIERMMVSIIESHDDFAEEVSEPQIDEKAHELPESGLALSGEQGEPQTEEPLPAEEPEEQPEPEEVQGKIFAEYPAEEDTGTAETEEDTLPQIETEEIFVPVRPEPKEQGEEAFIAVGSEEIKPDLEPVRVKRKKTSDENFPDITVTIDGVATAHNRESIEEIRRRRRRPLIFIIILCAILILAAVIFNALTEVPEIYAEPEETLVPEETADIPEETLPPEEPEVPEESAAPVEMVSTYEIVRANISWQEAKTMCEAKGGHLAVINNTDEYLRITTLLEGEGVAYAWIGLHRENGELIWETGEAAEELFTKWAPGEPSVFDGDIPEDYVLLWNNNGWLYNDCINDPAAQYNWYAGNIAYICETETPAE